MDVINILRKMRQEPRSLAVATADLTEEHPKICENIVVTVRVTGSIAQGRR